MPKNVAIAPNKKKRKRPKSSKWGGVRRKAGRTPTLSKEQVRSHRLTLLCNESLRARIEAVRLNNQESNSALIERLILPELERLESKH